MVFVCTFLKLYYALYNYICICYGMYAVRRQFVLSFRWKIQMKRGSKKKLNRISRSAYET